MPEPVTSTIPTVLHNNSFWQNIPAAAYVLLGVVISGFFTIFQSSMNNKANKELKDLENKNSMELKRIENDHARKLEELETESNEKIQIQNQNAQKALRLLEDKIKIFSDFYSGYSEILISGTNKQRHERIEQLRTSVYKARLLAPSLKKELDSLADKLNDYANFYFEVLQNTKTYTEGENKTENAKHLSLIVPQILEIFEKLSGEM